jgi:molybdate transport system regulatory protein
MAIRTSFRLRIYIDDIPAIGPGKVALLEAIIKTGSIRAAALSLEMSYNRAWLLINEMNDCFKQPVVIGSSGGSKGGGAMVTESGHRLVEEYRLLEKEALASSASRIKSLKALLKKQ